MSEKASHLRELFGSRKIVRIMGAHHGLGAKLIERAGFDGVWASGLEISTAHTVPDANILTMTENLDAARGINDACGLPVVCDCDTGYGNAANVIHMIKKYEAAGLAAAVIEDKHFPKVNSFVPGRQDLASVEEFCGKLEAARQAKKNEDFMVIARIEALIAGWGMEEALKRAHAYTEAGADGLVIHSKISTPDEIFEFAKRYQGKIPLVAIPTMYFDVTADQLAERGFKMVIYANHGLRASIRAMQDTFKIIHDTGSTAAVESKITSMKEVFEIQGMGTLKDTEKKYLKTEKLHVIIPAAGDARKHADFSTLLEDRPLCMLEIAGKTLLQHQVEMFRAAGGTDIHVVGGYRRENIRAEGITFVPNPAWAETQAAYSVMAAGEHLKGKCLVAYSDILFDRQILNLVLKSPHAITLVIDRAYKTLPARNKALELVMTENPAEGEKNRQMALNILKPVRKIGRQLDRARADCEFTGIAFFHESGFQKLREAWRTAHEQFQGKPFYEAASVDKAGFTDILQYVIDGGTPVYGIEIEHGWSEIHSLEDYRRVSEFFKSAENLSNVS